MTVFDKINLAQCAVRRAHQSLGFMNDSSRFSREFETASLWKDHNVYVSISTNGEALNYKLR